MGFFLQLFLFWFSLFEKVGISESHWWKTGELDKSSTTEESSVVRQEGKRKVCRKIKFYNLDAIISVGYRVNSKKGARFRIWATQRLKKYLKTDSLILPWYRRIRIWGTSYLIPTIEILRAGDFFGANLKDHF